MIQRDEALLLLRDACPSFRAHEVPAFPEDPHGFGDMAELSALARHLVDLAEAGDAEEFPAVFVVVDQLLVRGDEHTVAYVRTHLLEDIQNITSHLDVHVRPDDFRAVLGPAATRAWDELDEAWTEAGEHASEIGERRRQAEDYLAMGPTDRREAQSMTREMADGSLVSPADVLRFEATRHDAQLVQRNRRVRWLPLALIAVALLICLVGLVVLE
jgi:hypothetical protein